jgi:hypothetical protein
MIEKQGKVVSYKRRQGEGGRKEKEGERRKARWQGTGGRETEEEKRRKEREARQGGKEQHGGKQLGSRCDKEERRGEIMSGVTAVVDPSEDDQDTRQETSSK